MNSLFDHTITFRHAELRAAWSAIHAADAQVVTARRGGRAVDAAVAQVAEARRLAGTVPLDVGRASDREVNAAFRDKPDVKSRLETEWDSSAKVAYAKARDLAESATARIR